MNKVFFVGCLQGAGHLHDHPQRRPPRLRTVAAHEGLDRLAVHELHGVEVGLGVVPEVVNDGDVAMVEAGGGARLAQETVARAFLVHVQGVNDLQGDDLVQVVVDGLVGDAHRAPAQFPAAAVFPPQDAIMLEGKRFVGRHGRRGRWRAAGKFDNPAAGTLASSVLKGGAGGELSDKAGEVGACQAADGR